MSQEALLDQLSLLADPVRCRILLLLQEQELMVGEICEILQLPQSTVSRQLRSLADGDWVATRRDGTSRFYSVNGEALDPAQRRLWTLVQDEIAATPSAAQDRGRLREVLARRREKSQAFFSTAAGQWDRLREDLFGRDSHLRALAGLLDPEAVVGDLGCGTGAFADAIAPFVGQVVAVDDSREMLEAASERLAGHPNVSVRPGTLEHLPLDDGALDAAAIVLVLHHLPQPDRALAEAARVLRPNGRLLLVDMLPHEHDEYRQTMGHVWLGFSEPQMTRLLESAGFERVRWHALPPAPEGRGPALFAAAAGRKDTTRR
ncbi:MAG: metalloregulator ArsR/SmtB family transcription factor [Vicinamibacteraceae bacterium]|nr:metalloregulator ArsR/SmtB family transcription factor [Vicinamibacteraceae bacterium]